MINGMLITIYAKNMQFMLFNNTAKDVLHRQLDNVNDSLNLLSDDNLSCVRIFDLKIRSIFQYVIHNIFK